MGIKSLIKSILPKILVKRISKHSKYGFFGDYATWEDALRNTTGYHSPIIFEKLKISALKIKNSEDISERDTVVIRGQQQNSFVINKIVEIARKDGFAKVIDFGGSFGNTYLQHKRILNGITNLKWMIIEQTHISEFGQKEFGGDRLEFFNDDDLDKLLSLERPNIAMFGSSIQYTEHPYDILRKMTSNRIDAIIFDRTPLFSDPNQRERIVVQKVRPEIYDATYPAHVLNEKILVRFMSKKGYLLVESALQGHIAIDGYDTITLRGLIFERTK